MTLLLEILALAAVHAAFFICYPETGPMGDVYIAVSFLVWTSLLIFIRTGAKLLNLGYSLLGLTVKVILLAIVAIAVAATMPQRDRTSVLDKIRAGRYPDRNTVSAGLRRFGVNIDRGVQGGIKQLDHEVNDGMKKLDREAGKAIKNIKKGR